MFSCSLTCLFVSHWCSHCKLVSVSTVIGMSLSASVSTFSGGIATGIIIAVFLGVTEFLRSANGLDLGVHGGLPFAFCHQPAWAFPVKHAHAHAHAHTRCSCLLTHAHAGCLLVSGCTWLHIVNRSRSLIHVVERGMYHACTHTHTHTAGMTLRVSFSLAHLHCAAAVAV